MAQGYFRLVQMTSSFVVEPSGFLDTIGPELPAIVAMWHGQHFMVHYAWPKGARIAALISRHGDGELNAAVLRRLGVMPIRGSGGSAAKMRKRGGVAALRTMLRALQDGITIVMTADVPKISRIAGPGIISLAQLSGRPVYPIAVVSSQSYDFSSWDRASIGLPFGRIAIVLGNPVRVASDARPGELEHARLAVENGLETVHQRAHEIARTKNGWPGRDTHISPSQNSAPHVKNGAGS